MGTREWLLLVEESGWPTPPCPPWHMRRASNMGGFSTSSAPKIHHLRNPPKCLTMSIRHNIADSVTSISCGLLMTMVGLFSKAACLSTYAWVHTHYRLVDLPWNSPWTWIITAVLVDLGYYWFYLPAALAVPPSQFLVHFQFVFLFQFWIHSELIGDIGPLGLIFNTSTYHQVHHGSNRYCLDKNYGGFLSIWDRIFGTFQDLRPDEQTVYGLIDQPQFFNVVKHQLFYFPVLLGKVEGGPWWQKMAVGFWDPDGFQVSPGWETTTFAPRSLREKNISQTSLFLLISTLLSRWLLALFSTTTCLDSTQACPREAC